ncbi:MAG: ribonuclease R family protein, partial [Planctomycetota bacterium]
AATAAEITLDPAGREDLRQRPIFTIDPATAKDFDDAIEIERTRDGYRVGVHIADVSHFVPAGGVVDDEALARGTSCYLVNRVIPMLPEVLSNGMCSLVPEQDRYALSVYVDLDRNLDVTAIRPCESIIRSQQRFTYEQALALIERRDPSAEGADPVTFDSEIVEDLRTCHRLAQDLREQRERAGALNLFSVEQRFRLDAEGEPIEVEQESGDVAHQLIEEFMLLANRCVAQWLAERESACVYRMHGEPDEERLAQFQTILESYGINDAPVFDRGGLRTVLARLADEPPAARLVLNYLCLRSFQKAIYDVHTASHYALAFRRYLHFTSPIRRYPDLIVHRLVKRVLGLPAYQEVEHRVEHLDAFARQCSFLERRAEAAERDLRRLKAARYLAKRLGEVFSAVCLTAAPHGLYLRLLETGLEGLVPLRAFSDDYYEYDNERLALVGRNSGRVLGVGLEMDVVVEHVDISRGDVTFALGGGAERKAKPKVTAPPFDWD